MSVQERGTVNCWLLIKVFTPSKPQGGIQKGRLSNYRIWAHVASLTFLAFASAPHFVELLNGGGHNGGFVGEDARLEVAAVGRLHPHACAREVRAAHVADGLVDDDDLEMHPRAHYPFQHLGQSRVAVEVGTKVRSRFLRVDKPHLHALSEQFRQHSEKRLLGFPLQHIQVFDVGGPDPQRVLGLHRKVKHGGVVGGVGDEGEPNSKWSFFYFIAIDKVTLFCGWIHPPVFVIIQIVIVVSPSIKLSWFAVFSYMRSKPTEFIYIVLVLQ